MGKIEGKEINILKLFSEFWFIIPEYQRPYSWGSEQVNELLEDLLLACNENDEDEYFLGALVIQKTKTSDFLEYDILDGQQRITTLIIIISILRDLINDILLNEDLSVEEKEEFEDAKKTCKEMIFQHKSTSRRIPERARIIYKSRDLTSAFIKEFIIDNNIIDGISFLSNKKYKDKSITNLIVAIKEGLSFFSRLRVDRLKLRKYINFILGKIIFIYVSAESMQDAFKLFTIINNRGLPLHDYDIFKSDNIGAIEEKEREKYAQKWDELENDLGEEFPSFMSTFRFFTLCKRASKNLIDDFEENAYSSNKKILLKGKDTIDKIIEYRDLYYKLIKLNDFSDISNEYKNLISIINSELKARDWVAVLILFYKKFGQKNLIEFLKKLEMKFFAESLLSATSVQRQDKMIKIMDLIKSSSNVKDILNSDIFKFDKNRLKNILNGDVYQRFWAKYILLKYEYLCMDHSVYISDYKNLQIEHILPQRPNKGSQWLNDFSEEERENFINKLGNLILISGDKNKKLRNSDFKDKKEKYLIGKVDIMTGSKIYLSKINTWTSTEIKERQKLIISKILDVS
jgi:uncharacterized protein with ParB-like and HNH nuclease domain